MSASDEMKDMDQEEQAKPKPEAAPNGTQNEGQAGDQVEGQIDATETTESAEPSLEDQLAEANDRLLRTLAELENTRRRAERDRGEALKYGITNFARDVLGVADNLHRALEALPTESRTDLPEHVTALLEGVDATARDLQATLTRHKITPIEPLDEKFDPNRHEAMFEVPNSGKPAGTIIQVIETGYMIDDRLLRPARVGVAKDSDA